MEPNKSSNHKRGHSSEPAPSCRKSRRQMAPPAVLSRARESSEESQETIGRNIEVADDGNERQEAEIKQHRGSSHMPSTMPSRILAAATSERVLAIVSEGAQSDEDAESDKLSHSPRNEDEDEEDEELSDNEDKDDEETRNGSEDSLAFGHASTSRIPVSSSLPLKPTRVPAHLDGAGTFINYKGVIISNEAFYDTIAPQTGWFDDDAIDVVLKYIRTEIIDPLGDAAKDFCVLSVPQSQALMHSMTPDQVIEMLPEDFRTKIHFVMFVNNLAADQTYTSPTTYVCRTSGKHWSVLVISVNDRNAYHYDTILNSEGVGHNNANAEAIVTKLGNLLDKDIAFTPVRNMPRQSTVCGSGPMACAALRHLVGGRLVKRKRDKRVNMSLEWKHVHHVEARQWLVDLLQGHKDDLARADSMGTGA